MTTTLPCPTCQASLQPTRRQRHCSQASRQTAYRHRQPDIPIPTTRSRRDTTIYTCTDCEQHYLGEQCCPDCQRPCTRVGAGGLCPHCDEPIAINDLIDPPSP